jgi:hypothetical protein
VAVLATHSSPVLSARLLRYVAAEESQAGDEPAPPTAAAIAFSSARGAASALAVRWSDARVTLFPLSSLQLGAL